MSQSENTFLSLGYDFYDEVMPQVTGNAFKVAVVIYRETVGRKRQRDGWEQAPISYTMLEKQTGMSRSMLSRALKELLRKGIIRLCNSVGRWGMHLYSLASRFLGGKETTSTETILVQPQLPETGTELGLVVVPIRYQNRYRNETSSSTDSIPEPTPGTASQEARDEPKESLKERVKENNKERGDGEEGKEEEDEEDEKRRIQKRILLNKRILDAKEHARTARKIGKYAGWTEAQWNYEEKLAREELAALDEQVRSSA